MSFLFGRTRGSDTQRAADTIHDALIAVVRQPVFYIESGVPDTFLGRFEMLVLLASPVLRRLRAAGPDAEALAQRLVDTLFRRLDIAMRELGVSDVTVPKRMKRLAEAFGGRSMVYDQALEAGDRAQLAAAIRRNVFDDGADGHQLADFVLDCEQRTRANDLDDLRRGTLNYPAPVL